jgi:hypothetical protein
MDINRMSALEAIKLSLAENMLDGEWWEVVEDGEGGVFLQLVYNSGAPGRTVQLDPRMCIPTTNKKNEVDIVIVTGYDPPPCRYAGDFNDVVERGIGAGINPTVLPDRMFVIDEAQLFDTCHARQLQNVTTKSYPDPLKGQGDIQFQSQTDNPFYKLKEFEKLVTWVIRVTGMPTENSQAALVDYNFAETTSWLYTVPGPISFTRVTNIQNSPYYCPSIATSVDYFETTFTVDNQTFTDRYGDQWPLFIRPAKVMYTGYKVTQIIAFPEKSYVWVEPVPELIDAGEGTGWVYVLNENGGFDITLFYQPKTIDGIGWEEILGLIDGAGEDIALKVDNGSGTYDIVFDDDLVTSSVARTIVAGQSGLGMYVMNMWVDFTIDRPSVTVTAKDGSPALPWATDLRVEYAPIILKDLPAQKAYVYRQGTGSTTVKIGIDELAASIPDNDPTTCQNFEKTPETLLQDRTQGNVVDVTFPFLPDADACATVAETIYNYQNTGDVKTYTLTCGPDDEPELGAAVEGFETDLRIESINYSYSHGSSYTIEVALGPIFSSSGSWGQGNFGGQYEDIDRPAIVTWAGGDGVNYRVDVQGLGEFNAINTQEMVWRVGERVTVSVKNIPKVVP